MKPALPALTQSRLEAYAASALRVLGWLLGLILRLGAKGRSVRLQRALSVMECAVESMLFLKAVLRYGPAPRRRRHPFAPPGFRRVMRVRGSLFYKNAGIRARKASPLARVFALVEALAHPERAIAYFFKRICNGLRLAKLVPVAPPSDTLADGAQRVV